MTDQEFGEAICRKLLSIPIPEVSDEEVFAVYNAVEKKMRRRKAILFLRRWISYIAILLGIAVFGGLIYNKVKAQVNVVNPVKAEAKVEIKAKVGNVLSGKNSTGNQNPKSAVGKNLKPSSKSVNDQTPANNQAPDKKQYEDKIPESNLPKDIAAFAKKEGNDIQELEVPTFNLPGALSSVALPDLIKQEDLNGIEIRKNTFPNLNLGFATGIGFDLGKNFISYSLVEEISFLKRWSFSTGIKYSVYVHEKFKDENEFYNRKEEKFTRKYDPEKYNYVTSGISNIDIQSKSYQVPLTLNYKIGLKHNFNLLVSTGSNITINATQQVNFESIKSSPGNSELQYNSFVHKIYGPVFRDINLGFGLQCVWKRFSIDASPNLEVHLQKLNNDPPVYGLLKVRVLCRI